MSFDRSVKSSADEAPTLSEGPVAAEGAWRAGATGLSLHATSSSVAAASVRGCFMTRVRVKGWRPRGRWFPPSAAGLSQGDPVLCGPASRPGCLCRDGVSDDPLDGSGLVQSHGQLAFQDQPAVASRLTGE